MSLHLSPHLSPRRGYLLVCNRPVFTMVLSWFGCFAASPISVGFMARAAACVKVVALAKNLPHRSRENEFTDGRVENLRCEAQLYRVNICSLCFHIGENVVGGFPYDFSFTVHC